MASSREQPVTNEDAANLLLSLFEADTAGPISPSSADTRTLVASDVSVKESKEEGKDNQEQRREHGCRPSAKEMNDNTPRAVSYKSDLIHVLNQRLNRAVPNDLLLDRCLRENDWHLDKAEASFREAFDAAKLRNEVNLSGRLPWKLDYDFLLGAGTTHESHRRAIDYLFRLANLGRNKQEFFALTTLEIGLLLIKTSWIVEAAMPEVHHQLMKANRKQEIGESLRHLRSTPQTQLDKDQRLGLFLEISGTDDAFSAHQHLLEHAYGLGVAVDQWMKGGLATRKIPKASKKDTPLNKNPVWPHVEKENRWPDGRPVAQTLQEMDQDQIGTRKHDEELNNENPKGVLVRYDNHPARRGMPNPRKLEVETIRDGQYSKLRHRGITVPGSGKIGGNGREVNRNHRAVDWDNGEDIVEINKWYSQPRRRLTKTLRREQPARYVDAELDWLQRWYRRTYDDFLAANPRYREEGGKWPIQIDKKKLEREFNAQFEGKTDVPGAEGVPRPNRNGGGLSVRASREEWCKELGLRFNVAHKKRRGDVRADNSGKPSTLVDSDEKSIGDEEAEQGATTPQKVFGRRKRSLESESDTEAIGKSAKRRRS